VSVAGEAIAASPSACRADDCTEAEAKSPSLKGTLIRGRDPESAGIRAQLGALRFSRFASTSAFKRRGKVIGRLDSLRRF
jgi:hypothetical protein